MSNNTVEINFPKVELKALDNLWFQVSGTLCNIACHHCFISCSPTNHNFEFLTFDEVKRSVDESMDIGVKEYYFTGGEPFMNKHLLDMIEYIMEFGPVTVLSNGMLIKEETAKRLAGIEKNSIYSLEIRISIDGYTEEMNDAIRGQGVFKKAMQGVQNLFNNGFLPIITVTKTWEESEDEKVLKGFVKLLKSHGYNRPRIKILPSIKIGQEKVRTKGYDKYEYVAEEMMEGYEESNLLCSNSRVVTNRGIAVCPILIEAPDAILGKTLSDSMKSYKLAHQACYTCYLYGAICSNFSSGSGNE